uniref:Uncharacterized protein n=1 Tax=Arundo donax TaxID=35708 RepID=A0A0A8ZAZ8_ARUDO
MDAYFTYLALNVNSFTLYFSSLNKILCKLLS